MNQNKNLEAKVIFGAFAVIFLAFLVVPMIILAVESFAGEGDSVFYNYVSVFADDDFLPAVGNSFLVSSISALLTTAIAFFMAYTINYTNVPKIYKKIIKIVAIFPMLLPTITYGFAIIYSFGKQGLMTQILGFQPFEIYGFNGLLLGYSIYTLPVSFLLIQNTMGYIDKKYMIVSRNMGDGPSRTLWTTIVYPLLGTLAASFVQCFTLAFTDYGIPASIGGEFQVVASLLYDEMLGSVPNFNNGAVVAIFMLIPSAFSIGLLRYLDRFNIKYSKVSQVENPKNHLRDALCGVGSVAVMITIASVFLVIFVVIFVEEWPYRLGFTTENITSVLGDPSLIAVYKNSLVVAVLTAAIGTGLAYAAALVTVRSKINGVCKRIIEGTSLVTCTIPGMVIGISFMLLFTGTGLQNTLILIIIANVVHFFSTPFLMMKNSLEKMNTSWETTALLMGDSWIKTVRRIITPNAVTTLLEVFGYYFINAMVTVSAVIFLAGAETMVVTTKIKELQHFMKFNEIFVLSILILLTNIIVKIVLEYIISRRNANK